jgi:hypothetical protein
MKHLIIILIAIFATLSFAKSSRSTSNGMRNSGWGSSSKRPGSSGKATNNSAPLGMKLGKINTSSLSDPNRSALAATPKAPVGPVASALKPTPAQAVTPPSGKINTSSLSNRNLPQPVASAKAPASVQASVTPTPTVVKTTNVTNVTVNKYVHHTSYDHGYTYRPAPVIFVSGAPLYSFHGHNYPIIIERDHYYANVDGQRVELDPNGDTWNEVTPQPTAPVAQAPASVPEPKVVPTKPDTGMNPVIKFLLWSLLVSVVVFGGVGLFILLRGDKDR